MRGRQSHSRSLAASAINSTGITYSEKYPSDKYLLASSWPKVRQRLATTTDSDCMMWYCHLHYVEFIKGIHRGTREPEGSHHIKDSHPKLMLH